MPEPAKCWFHPNDPNGEHQFGAPVTPETFGSIDFSLDSSWRSSEDQRIAAEAQAKADAEQAKADEIVEKEQAKQDALAAARDAAERRKIRATCAFVYRNTIDKKISDLTVREEQQVRARKALDLYPPQ